jgi:TfoX N-terminal domain
MSGRRLDSITVLLGDPLAPLLPVGDHLSAVAYNEDLANRIRELVAAEPDVTEQRMFGGLAFLIGGNMSVAASGQGGLMVRVDPGDSDALLTKPHVRPFEMRGRAMRGWLRVDPEGLRTKRQLGPWVTRGVTYARSLPAKH